MSARSFNASRALRGGASTIVLSAMLFAPAAYAQDTTTTTTAQAEETKPLSAQTDPAATATPGDEPGAIVVTGQRRALRNSQQIKRNADTVVDSITATDIGAFPDKSVAEALQRVPGITVNRFAATSDTAHFSAEPSGVIVRGLPQVRSEFNGRDTFSANSSRGLSWGDVTPELMAGVDTYKNQTAELIEGGIAGSINLRTRVPFDAPGQLIQAGINLNYGDLAKKWTPEGNVFYSNRWDTGFGEVGLMGNLAFSKVNTSSEGIQYGRAGIFVGVTGTANPGFANAPAIAYAPSGVSFRDNEYARTRIGVALAGQWKSLDDRMVLTTQYNRSNYKEQWDERVFSASFFDLFGQNTSFRYGPGNSQNPRLAPGTAPFTFGDDGFITEGTFANYNGWFGNTGTNAAPGDPRFGVNQAGQPIFQSCYAWGCPTSGAARPVDTYGAGVATASRWSDSRRMTQDVAANLKWQATDRLRFNFDAQRVNSTVENYDIEIDLNSRANVKAEFLGQPSIELLAPTNVNFSPGHLANPNNYYINAVMDHIEDSKGKEVAFRGDGEYDINTDWLDSIKFGARYADRDQDLQWSTYNWHNIANTWTATNDPTRINPANGQPCTFDENGSSSPDNGDPFPCRDITHPYFNADSGPFSYWGADGIQGTADDVKFPGYPSGLTEVSPLSTNLYGGRIGEFTFVPVEFLRNRRADELSLDRIGVGQFIPTCERNGQRTNPTDPNSAVVGVEVEGSCFTPDEIGTISETTKAVYAMLRFGGPNAQLGSVGVSGNLGLRYVSTKDRSQGWLQYATIPGNPNQCPATPLVPGGLTGVGQPANPPAPAPAPFAAFPAFCYLSAQDIAFSAALADRSAPSTITTTHRHFLPSFNVRFDLDPKWVLRFAASKALSRPDFGQIRNIQTVSMQLPAGTANTDPRWILGTNGRPVGVTPTYTATANTPYLKPITAWQFDLSLENYFANVGSFTAAIFYKTFQNYIQNQLIDEQITHNGVTRTVRTGRPVNADGAKVSGAEIAYQRFFDFLPGALSGLGTQLNFTYIKNKGVDNIGVADPDGGGFTGGTILEPGSLEGLSKYSYNVVGMYEKFGISARLAYNWRSKYLVTAVDCCVALPVWQKAAGFLDGSIRYSVTKNVELSVQGSNLLNTQTKLEQQITDVNSPEKKRILVPNAWFQNDRRFVIGARVKFGQ